MQVNGALNKFQIFQDYYFMVNGEMISYADALRLYSELTKEEKNEFEQYYKDETGYQIISPSGYNLDNESKDKSGYISVKYSIQAYAAKNGLVLDPQWSIYSAEEIIMMANNGVNIPQEIIDIAHTIYQSAGVNMDGDENSDETTEPEPFLKLIPKAEKKIEKCELNNEKIIKEIEDITPEVGRKKKRFKNEMDEKTKSLKKFEADIREWRRLQNKINNGEALSYGEAKRYAKITGMLQDRNNKDNFSLDKRAITRALNELNIFAILGEKLADETIEIGELLTDYTSKANYKTTRKQVSGEIGLFRAIFAMIHGKNLGNYAVEFGNETKEFTDETHKTVYDIAEVLDVEDSLSKVTFTEDAAQPAAQDASEDAQIEPQQAPVEEDVIVNDDTVKELTKEARIINSDLFGQIMDAAKNVSNAKKDKAFAKYAGKKIRRFVQQMQQEEEQRKQEIQKLEEENKSTKKEIEEITGQSADEIDEEITSGKISEDNENGDDQNPEKEKVKALKAKIINNNGQIENLKAETEDSIVKFKEKTAKESKRLETSIPKETENLEKDTKYKDEIIPQDKEQLKLTENTGKTLARMGTYRVIVGVQQIMAMQIRQGLKNVAKGTVSQVIGAGAIMVADTPIPKIADKATKAAVKNEDQAITALTEVDSQIASITGESAVTPADEAAQSESGEAGESTESAEATDSEKTEATQTTTAESTESAATESTATKETTTAMADANVKASVYDMSSKGTVAKAASNSTDKKPGGAMLNMIAANHSEKDRLKEIAGKGEGTASKKSSGKKSNKPDASQDSGPVKDEQTKAGDKNNKELNKTDSSAKNDSKESEDLLKETKKDKKTLEKESKRLQKQLKNDEKKIVKMTQESMDAAKKQEEILAEYETLVAENEKLMAEDEAKKQSQAAVQGPQQQQNNDEQQGGLLATNSMSMNPAQGANSSDNTQRLQANGERINELGTQFKIYGNKINRNQTKIKKIQKSTKATEKKLKKKTKALNKKIKADQKKEQEKQKRLAKQLAAVGIIENAFSLTVSIGTIWEIIATGELSNPFTAGKGIADMAVSQILIYIGTLGVAACGVTKALINIANGNLTAGLIGLGMTAVSVATTVTGVGGATNKVLTYVAQGLSVVSTSAELVNNVRAVQGKEASGVFSKISTVAGIASSLTNVAAGFSKSVDKAGKTVDSAFKQAGTFGKAMQIASAAGTAMSATSQIMSTFGLGNEKTANMLGMIGGGLQSAASVAQIAQSFSNAKNKNDQQQQQNQNNNNNDNNTTPKPKNNTDTTPKPNKPDSQNPQTQKPQNSQTQGSQDPQTQGPKTEPKINPDGTIPGELGLPKVEVNPEKLAGKLQITPKEKSFFEKAQPWMEMAGQAMGVVGQVFGATNDQPQQDSKKKKPAAQWDSTRMRKINELKKKRLKRQQYYRNYQYRA